MFHFLKAIQDPEFNKISFEEVEKRMRPFGDGFIFKKTANRNRIFASFGTDNPIERNCVSLTLPRQKFPGEEANQDKLKQLLKIVIKHWEPDFAIISTEEMYDSEFDDFEQTYLDWKKRMIKCAWVSSASLLSIWREAEQYLWERISKRRPNKLLKQL